jgi:MFS family permease
MRILLGIFQAFMNPTAYSIIADYFPPERRTMANSIFNLSIYFGGALASLSTVLMSAAGWRFTYILISFICLGLSVLGVFMIYNPERGRWDAKKKEIVVNEDTLKIEKKSTVKKFLAAMKELFENPTCRWVSLGGFFRFFGGFSIAFFMPQFFRLIWYNDTSDQSK